MKKIAVFLGLLLCLCVSSWGRCGTAGVDFNGSFIGSYGTCGSCLSTIPGSWINANCGLIGATTCVLSNWTCNAGRCFYKTMCGEQAEADSVTIAQKCATGTMVKDTVGATIFDACQNGEGLLIAFNNPITGVHNASIGYYIVTDDSADSLDEATYNHLASLACTEVSLYRGVLNGKYVYWYSTDPEPAGVVNVVRIK